MAPWRHAVKRHGGAENLDTTATRDHNPLSEYRARNTSVTHDVSRRKRYISKLSNIPMFSTLVAVYLPYFFAPMHLERIERSRELRKMSRALPHAAYN